MLKHLTITLAITLFFTTVHRVAANPVFNRIATFPVAENIPTDIDNSRESSAEIIAANENGSLLVYTDSPLQALGLIDISDPEQPKAAGQAGWGADLSCTGL